MATFKQIAANRRNALKSTGPKTPEGKAIVRLNSLRHGLRARTVVLPGESREEFNQLCDDLEAEWRPKSSSAQFYLEQMAISQWKLIRMEGSEANIFQEAPRGQASLPLLDRLWQAQCRLERSYARANVSCSASKIIGPRGSTSPSRRRKKSRPRHSRSRSPFRPGALPDFLCVEPIRRAAS